MILVHIFGQLFDRGMILIATSNRHPDALYENGIQRKSFIPCIERIKKECGVISLSSGLDYRQTGTKCCLPAPHDLNNIEGLF